MLRHSVRVLVAVLTFTIGIVLVWAMQLVPRLETALVDRFFVSDESNAIPAFCDFGEDANQIYRLLIHNEFTFENTSLIVLESETANCSLFEVESVRTLQGHTDTFQQIMKQRMPEADLQTLDNYLANNKSRESLRISNPGIAYVLLKSSDIPDDGPDGFWSRFYRKYPGSSGIIFFSNVGFNDQHTQALVYAARSCGGLCGEGGYFLLTKVTGQWEILRQEIVWVS